MTNKRTTTFTHANTTSELTPGVAKVLAALHRLGEATAAATATEAAFGYSTTTPKLRALENADLAEHFRSDDGRTLWRLTDTGRARAAQTGDQEPARPQPEPTDDSTADATTPPGARLGDAANATAPVEPEPATQVAGQPPAAETEAANAAAGHDGNEPAEQDTAAHTDGHIDSAAGVEPADAVPDAARGAEPVADTGNRRASGTLRGAILDILQANPTQGYKVSELCKLIDQASAGTGAKRAGGGAVVNAANKLVQDGRAILAVERPDTFVLAHGNK